MTPHGTGLYAREAVTRLEVAMEDASFVEPVGTPRGVG